MATSYERIRKQIETLQAEADKLRRQEAGEVIARIKEAIAHYGLTSADLFSAAKGRAAPRATAAKRSAPAARFTDGHGSSWGGRGPRPKWLRAALASGKKLEDFEAQRAATVNGAEPVAKAKATRKKRAASMGYRDDSGNTWSGKGRKPRWFLEALAAGRTPEDMAAK
jgi:DNA-binding protein H-NS